MAVNKNNKNVVLALSPGCQKFYYLFLISIQNNNIYYDRIIFSEGKKKCK